VWETRLAPEPGETAAAESLGKGMAEDNDEDSGAEGEDAGDELGEGAASGSDGAAEEGGAGAGAAVGGPRLKRRRRPDGEDSSGGTAGGSALRALRSRLRSSVRLALLNGLFDRDRSVRARAYAFWDSPRRLSPSLPARLLQLMRLLFDPRGGAARPWMHHAAPLLLALATRGDPASFHSRTALFPFALGDSGVEQELMDVALVTGHGASTATGTMRPLFSDAGGNGGGGGSGGGGGGGGVVGVTSAMIQAAASLRVGLAFGVVRATQAGGGGYAGASGATDGPLFSLTQAQAQAPGGDLFFYRARRGGLVASFAPEGPTFGASLSQRGGGARDAGSLAAGVSAARGAATSSSGPAKLQSLPTLWQQIRAGHAAGHAHARSHTGASPAAAAQARRAGEDPAAPHPAAPTQSAPPPAASFYYESSFAAESSGRYDFFGDSGGRFAAMPLLLPKGMGAGELGAGMGDGAAAMAQGVASGAHLGEMAVGRRDAQARLLRARQRAPNVRLTRAYRVGELPDIQASSQAQLMRKRDSILPDARPRAALSPLTRAHLTPHLRNLCDPHCRWRRAPSCCRSKLCARPTCSWRATRSRSSSLPRTQRCRPLALLLLWRAPRRPRKRARARPICTASCRRARARVRVRAWDAAAL
jgi:hypothetical protein